MLQCLTLLHLFLETQVFLITEFDPIFIFLPALMTHASQFQTMEQILQAFDKTRGGGDAIMDSSNLDDLQMGSPEKRPQE